MPETKEEEIEEMVRDLEKRRSSIRGFSKGPPKDEAKTHNEIEKALQGDNEYVKALAELASGRIGETKEATVTSPPIEKEYLHKLAKRAHKGLQERRNTSKLIDRLSSTDHQIRNNAIIEIGKSEKEDLNPIIKAIGSPDWFTGIGATIALGIIGKQSLEALIRSLEHNNPIIRARSARALGWQGSEIAGPALIKLFNKEKNDLVKYEIAMALATIGGKEAKKTLASTSFFKP